MALWISVGYLDDLARNDPDEVAEHRQAFDRLGRALGAEGIDWREPAVADPPRAAVFSGGFPYSFLTQLRRILALANLGEPVTPARSVSRDEYDRDCARIDDETAMLASHLLCHADDSGYYVPVDFADPLFLPDETDGVGLVGSSQRLLAELASIAAPIGIDPDTVPTGPGPTTELVTADEPFGTERFVWRQLYRAGRASVASGHAIVFH